MEYIQNQLDAPVFTANLRAGNKDGTLEFGYVDESLYCGTLHTVSIDNSTDGSWTVDQVLMTVGDVQVIQPMLFGAYPPFPLPPFPHSTTFFFCLN